MNNTTMLLIPIMNRAIWKGPSDSEKILFTAGLSILSIITLFGNTLVVVSFRTYRPLRNLTNFFIVSLSTSDILVAAISMPVWIAFLINNMDFSIYDYMVNIIYFSQGPSPNFVTGRSVLNQ